LGGRVIQRGSVSLIRGQRLMAMRGGKQREWEEVWRKGEGISCMGQRISTGKAWKALSSNETTRTSQMLA